jgi:DNA-binding transcriptional LysR family regulator
MASKADPSELISGMLVFHQVVVSGSFSAAARRLDLSPSAVSRQIDRLEKLLGVVLLARSTRNLSVTESGQDVFSVASEIATTTDNLINRIEASRVKPSGLLRVTAPVTIGKILLSNTAGEFLKTYPDIDIEFNFTDNIIDIYKEKYDLSLRVTSQPPQDMVARKLFEVEYLLVAGTGKLDFQIPLHPEDIPKTPLITPSDSFFGSEVTFDRDDYSYTVRSCPRLIANNSETLMRSILEGVGIGIVPNFLAFPSMARGELQPLLTDWRIHNSTPTALYLLSMPSKMISAKARAYIEFLKDRIGDNLLHDKNFNTSM